MLGVSANVVVPLCFEKSKWASICMLAIMKAGGATVALDPGQPEERLRTILDQVRPTVVLSSALNHPLMSRLTSAPVLPIDQTQVRELEPMIHPTALPAVSPSDALYVVFTSG